MTRKMATLLLALTLLAASILPAASAEGVLPHEGDEITISMFGWNSYSDYDWASKFGKWLSGKLGNVKLTVEIPDDDATPLIPLYMSTGEMPDIMMYRNPDDFYTNWADTGVALNLLDYADIMPEYTARREQFAHLSSYDTEDGKCYLYFPAWYDACCEIWYANKALLDKYDLEIPATYDEMMHCCDVVCAAEEGVTGIVNMSYWGFMYSLQQYSMLFGGNREAPAGIYYDYETGRWEFNLTHNEEIWRNTAAGMAEAYKNGYLNPDFVNFSDTDFLNIYGTGSFLFSFAYYNFPSSFGPDDLDWVYMAPPAVEGATPRISCDYTSDCTSWAYFVNAKTEHPEVCCAILELLGSKEYAEALYWGFEGETFETDAEGGCQYTEAFLNADDETKKAYGLCDGFSNGYYFSNPFVSNYYVFDAICNNFLPVEQDALTQTSKALADGSVSVYYTALRPAIDAYDQEDIDLALSTIGTYVSENMVAFVLGTKDMGEWDAFMDGLSQYGDIDAIVEIYNAAEQKPLRAQQADRTYMAP